MSRVLARWRWQWYRDRLGPDHPRVRALFGRYVAAVGGALTPRAGGVAYRAWQRRREPGFYNRSYRRHHVWDL